MFWAAQLAYIRNSLVKHVIRNQTWEWCGCCCREDCVRLSFSTCDQCLPPQGAQMSPHSSEEYEVVRRAYRGSGSSRRQNALDVNAGHATIVRPNISEHSYHVFPSPNPYHQLHRECSHLLPITFSSWSPQICCFHLCNFAQLSSQPPTLPHTPLPRSTWHRAAWVTCLSQ